MPDRNDKGLAAEIGDINADMERCARGGDLARLLRLLAGRRRMLHEALGPPGGGPADAAELLAGSAAANRRCLPVLRAWLETTRGRIETVVRRRSCLNLLRGIPAGETSGRIVNGRG
jgi:hypothetical protein